MKAGDSLQTLYSALEFVHPLQSAAPTRLKLASDMPLCWVDKFVSARSERGVISRGLKLPLDGGDGLLPRTLDPI
jgi:hypothetical protein